MFLRLSKQNSPKLANSSAHPPPFTFTCSCLRIDRGGFVTQTRLHFVFVILPKPSNELRKGFLFGMSKEGTSLIRVAASGAGAFFASCLSLSLFAVPNR